MALFASSVQASPKTLRRNDSSPTLKNNSIPTQPRHCAQTPTDILTPVAAPAHALAKQTVTNPPSKALPFGQGVDKGTSYLSWTQATDSADSPTGTVKGKRTSAPVSAPHSGHVAPSVSHGQATTSSSKSASAPYPRSKRSPPVWSPAHPFGKGTSKSAAKRNTEAKWERVPSDPSTATDLIQAAKDNQYSGSYARSGKGGKGGKGSSSKSVDYNHGKYPVASPIYAGGGGKDGKGGKGSTSRSAFYPPSGCPDEAPEPSNNTNQPTESSSSGVMTSAPSSFHSESNVPSYNPTSAPSTDNSGREGILRRSMLLSSSCRNKTEEKQQPQQQSSF